MSPFQNIYDKVFTGWKKGWGGGGCDLAMMHISIHGSSAFTLSMNTLHTKSYKVTGVFILYTHVSQLIARSCIFIWHLFSIIEDFLLRGLVILNTFYWYMTGIWQIEVMEKYKILQIT